MLPRCLQYTPLARAPARSTSSLFGMFLRVVGLVYSWQRRNFAINTQERPFTPGHAASFLVNEMHFTHIHAAALAFTLAGARTPTAEITLARFAHRSAKRRGRIISAIRVDTEISARWNNPLPPHSRKTSRTYPQNAFLATRPRCCCFAEVTSQLCCRSAA